MAQFQPFRISRGRRLGELAGAGGMIILSLFSFAAMARAQSLEDAMTQAYLSNPTLEAARAELRAVNEGVPQALSNWRPDVSLNAAAGKARTSSEFGTATTSYLTPRSAELAVDQPLYRGGRTQAATDAAELQVLSFREVLRSREQDVLFSAVTAYMDVWRDQSVLRLNRNNEAVLARQLEAARDRFEVGEITRTDVAQSETRLAAATASRIGSEGDLAASRAVYLEVVVGSPGELTRPDAEPTLPASEADLIGLGLDNNPDVLAGEFAEQAARKRTREIEGELYPTVSLVGSLSTSRETSVPGSDSEDARLLAQLRIPLYQQGAVSSRVRQSKQTANQTRLELEAVRRSVSQTAASAWVRLLAARAQIDSFESAVRSARIALDGVREENAVGARTILDVLDAEQELLDAEVGLVSAQRDLYVADYAVLLAAGQLSITRFVEDIEAYDPEPDYQAVRNKWFGLGIPDSEK